MKTGLVMEGGAMRGLFTCGVIDVLMENKIVFDGGAGISAGAVFGCNYKSKQIGRPHRYNINLCKDPRYGTLRSLLKTGDFYDADFCYREVPEELDVFDAETFEKNPMEFYVGATDIESGKCVYHKCKNGRELDNRWIRASASMPLVSRPVEIDDHLYLDGGIVDSIPYRILTENAYEKCVVILTQPKGFIKKKNSLLPLIRVVMHKYPNLIKAMATRHERYNLEVKDVEEAERLGKVLIVRPPQPLNVGRTEHDPKELERVYQIGRAEGRRKLKEIVRFLNSDEYEIIDNTKDRIRKHFHIYGTVQGVGFRFYALRAAEALGLSGWVKNEDDGSVSMELQGKEYEISRAIEMINENRYVQIEKIEEKIIPLLEDESGFVADYW